MHHLTCGISPSHSSIVIHSVHLILFTLLLVHLISYASPHHSQHQFLLYAGLVILRHDLRTADFRETELCSFKDRSLKVIGISICECYVCPHPPPDRGIR